MVHNLLAQDMASNITIRQPFSFIPFLFRGLERADFFFSVINSCDADSNFSIIQNNALVARGQDVFLPNSIPNVHDRV